MNEDKTQIDRASSEVNVDQQVRRCLICKHLTDLYQIENRFYGQCWVELPDEIQTKLPSCFYRQAAIMVGIDDSSIRMWNNNGCDCPYWIDKASA